MRVLLSIWLLVVAVSAGAQTVVARQAIRAQTIITPEMVQLDNQTTSGAFAALAEVLGQEARVNIYPGRPVMITDLGSPAILERNQLVTLIFHRGALQITSEGRVLARAGIGETVRVMNLDSRTIIFGRVTESGAIEVGI